MSGIALDPDPFFRDLSSEDSMDRYPMSNSAAGLTPYMAACRRTAAWECGAFLSSFLIIFIAMHIIGCSENDREEKRT
jgi:hypothetical protein